MAELKHIGLGAAELQRTEEINENFSELERRKVDKAANGFATLDASGQVTENAKTATVAKDYDSSGTIKTALDNINSSISNIVDGTTTVGKAGALNPAVAPGNLKYYGTDEFGNMGWHDYTIGSDDPTGMTAVAFSSSSDWSESGNYHVLSLPHGNKYPSGVFKETSGELEKVVVGVRRNTENVIIIADSPFAGIILLG